MTAARLAALVAMAALTGCVYFNALYNANRAFGEGRSALLRGDADRARASFQTAVEKAARAYRSDREGRWADDALLLIGKAHLAREDPALAEAALRQALAITDDPGLEARARLYLAASLVAGGDVRAGLPALDTALAADLDEETLAEGRLWRSRGLFQVGRSDEAWSDLEEVVRLQPAFDGRTALERTTLGVERDAFQQSLNGAASLLARPAHSGSTDSLLTLIQVARRTWGPGPAAELLAPARGSLWPLTQRRRLMLRRAELLGEAGDMEAARAEASAVADGVDRFADEGRVLLARWELAAVTSLDQLEEPRARLLPAVGSRNAVALLETIKVIGLLVERAGRRGEASALFGAAELARDSLGASGLARELFLTYADQQRGSAWEGKALLAAIELSQEPEAGVLRERLLALEGNPYASAARGRGGGAAPLGVLERRLQTILRTVRQQVATEAQFRDVAVTLAARSLDSIRTAEELRRRIAAGDSALIDSLRLDSIRVDSLRLDSIRADSIRRDSLGIDTFGIAVDRGAGPAPRLIRIPGPATVGDP